MLGAFLTTIFFSLSSIFANRAIRTVGATRANLARLAVAIACLGTWAHLVPLLGLGIGGTGFAGAGLLYFLASGVLGMGFGDLAVFAALPLLGARLTVVMTQCLAVPIGAVAEWLWLGTTLTVSQIAWSTVIVGGVALALLPSRAHPPRVRVRFSGVLFGVVAALGQGLGAVLSRKAYNVTFAEGQTIDGVTATYQRIVGGLAITLLYLAIRTLLRQGTRSARSDETPTAGSTGTGLWRWRWTAANGISGAVLGVSCYQWALATTPSGIVLPIVATTPLVVVPFAYWMEGERPTRRSLVGGAIAVGGAVALRIVA
ncbi:EamA family transporter [Opitutaceae bacterium EW11]|nr:EamA family transporter [Opitutaceae bacterium EW11]